MLNKRGAIFFLSRSFVSYIAIFLPMLVRTTSSVSILKLAFWIKSLVYNKNYQLNKRVTSKHRKRYNKGLMKKSLSQLASPLPAFASHKSTAHKT